MKKLGFVLMMSMVLTASAAGIQIQKLIDGLTTKPSAPQPAPQAPKPPALPQAPRPIKK